MGLEASISGDFVSLDADIMVYEDAVMGWGCWNCDILTLWYICINMGRVKCNCDRCRHLGIRIIVKSSSDSGCHCRHGSQQSDSPLQFLATAKEEEMSSAYVIQALAAMYLSGIFAEARPGSEYLDRERRPHSGARSMNKHI